LYWRDEVLEVMFWMRGEGLNESPKTEELATFLNVEAAALRTHLQCMVEDGRLVCSRDNDDVERYSLTSSGRAEGGKLFAEEFSGQTSNGHFACSPDCDCDTATSTTGTCRHQASTESAP